MQRAVGEGIAEPVVGAGSVVVMDAVVVCKLGNCVRRVGVVAGAWGVVRVAVVERAGGAVGARAVVVG